MGSDSEILLNTIEAAQFLRQRARVLEAWRYRGVGPAYIRISRSSVRYRRSDLVAFLDEMTVVPSRGREVAA